jgi:hypothetical protein
MALFQLVFIKGVTCVVDEPEVKKQAVELIQIEKERPNSQYSHVPSDRRCCRTKKEMNNRRGVEKLKDGEIEAKMMIKILGPEQRN